MPAGEIRCCATWRTADDRLYRLTAADYDNGTYFHYTYDPVGNRLSQTLTGGLVNTYTYDIANRLTAVGVQAYTWDANGNLLYDGTNSYLCGAMRLGEVHPGGSWRGPMGT